jgi:hypothetical protein
MVSWEEEAATPRGLLRTGFPQPDQAAAVAVAEVDPAVAARLGLGSLGFVDLDL